MNYGECFQIPKTNQWAVVTTSQTDFSKKIDMAKMGDPTKKSTMKFDKYFYHAIDHQGKEPGSMEPGCMSNRDCMGGGRRKLDGHKGGRDGDHDGMKGGMKGDRMCCAHANVYLKDQGMSHDIYRCMDKMTVHQNMQMDMEDTKMEMYCMDGMKMKAASTLMVAASAIGLAAMNLF